MPLITERSSAGCAYPSVKPYGDSLQPPPRIYRSSPAASFSHHSRTLPARSKTPYGLMPRQLLPRTGPLLSKLLPVTMKRAAPIDAALAQWKIVGNALPVYLAYAAASYQLT